MSIAEDIVAIYRSDTGDVVKPYLWSDEECFEYLGDAYQQYVKLSGGVPDLFSDEIAIAVSTGERIVDLHPAILKIISAYRDSDSKPVTVFNMEDAAQYEMQPSRMMANAAGPVNYLVLGIAPDKGLLVDTPEVDDTIRLHVMRMPLDSTVTTSSTLPEVPQWHRRSLVTWMKHRGYGKQDADTFDPAASEKAEVDFNRYCASVKAELERKKSKVRTVAYGGI